MERRSALIVGVRIQLRAVELEDSSLMMEWRNDHRVHQYFYEYEPLSLAAQRAWFERYLTRSDERIWIVETKDTREAIGTVGLVRLDWRNRKAEGGRLMIYPEEYRRADYANEVESLFLRYAFDHMNLNRIECGVLLENEIVWKMQLKFGFRREGVFRQYVFRDGRYRDVVFLAMLREDYLSAETQARIARYLD